MNHITLIITVMLIIVLGGYTVAKNNPIYINNQKIKPVYGMYKFKNNVGTILLLKDQKVVVFGSNTSSNSIPPNINEPITSMITYFNKIYSKLVSKKYDITIPKIINNTFGNILNYSYGTIIYNDSNNIGLYGGNELNISQIMNIYGMYIGGGYTILIYKNGEVYVKGENKNGQLGLGDTISRSKLVRNINIGNIITDVNVSDIYGLYYGDKYSVLIFKNGKVYVWGYNSHGELGLGSDSNDEIHIPVENIKLEQIIQKYGGGKNIYGLYIGGYNILVLKNGKVYVWGKDINGISESTDIENVIYNNGGVDNIQGFYVGGDEDDNFNILIFKNGSVYVWGSNWEGQTGIGNCNEIDSPVENNILEKIIQNNNGTSNIYTLTTGGNHNILIFKNGSVYVWGWNEYGELGINSTYDQYKPVENKYLENIIQKNNGVDNIYGLYTGGNTWSGYNILVFKNGSVYVWGYNEDGELGLNNTNDVYIPTENGIIENIIQENGGIENIYKIYPGNNYVIIIFKNNKVYVWGYNENGELGFNDTINRKIPIENPYLEKIIQENGGVKHIFRFYPCGDEENNYNILIFDDNKIYVWGDNSYGELAIGDPMISYSSIKIPIENTILEDITYVNSITWNIVVDNIYTLNIGDDFNILILKDGKVYVWGSNFGGQLGTGDTNYKRVPTENSILENIIYSNGGTKNIYKLYTGDIQNILIFKNNKVYVWGFNGDGELGLNDTTNRIVPTENPYLEKIIQENGGTVNIKKLCSKADFSILIFKNGKVYVWGDNRYGGLGLNDTTNRIVPTENPYLEKIIQENGGTNEIYKIYSINDHNILIFKNGRVYAWGYNDDGRLGLGDTKQRNLPTENKNIENIIYKEGGIKNIYNLYTSEGNSILIFKNGTIYTWGITPTENHTLETIVQDNKGTYNIYKLYTVSIYNILIFKNGKVYVWGDNEYGQLGLGDTNNRNTPQENLNIENIIQQNGEVENIYKLYTGNDLGGGHNILIFKNGRVYVWGWNDDYQLGLGDHTDKRNLTENYNIEEVIIKDIKINNVYKIYTNWNSNTLIFKNGSVYVWGDNKYGQLGTGDYNCRCIPKENNIIEQVIYNNDGIKNIQNIYTGFYHNILIFKNGSVYVWGDNEYGQLGLGDTNNRSTPVENTNIENIIQQNGGVENIQGLYIGSTFNILIFKNDKVYVWGYNKDGELGIGDTINKITPTENIILEKIIKKNGGVNNIQGLYVGSDFSILVFKNTETYVWGNNKQVGVGNNQSYDTTVPIKNSYLEFIFHNYNLPIPNIPISTIILNT